MMLIDIYNGMIGFESGRMTVEWTRECRVINMVLVIGLASRVMVASHVHQHSAMEVSQ